MAGHTGLAPAYLSFIFPSLSAELQMGLAMLVGIANLLRVWVYESTRAKTFEP